MTIHYRFMKSDVFHYPLLSSPLPSPPAARGPGFNRWTPGPGWPLCVSFAVHGSVAGLGDCGEGSTPRRTMKLLGFAVGAAGEREARENPEGARGLQGQKEDFCSPPRFWDRRPTQGVLASGREAEPG